MSTWIDIQEAAELVGRSTKQIRRIMKNFDDTDVKRVEFGKIMLRKKKVMQHYSMTPINTPNRAKAAVADKPKTPMQKAKPNNQKPIPDASPNKKENTTSIQEEALPVAEKKQTQQPLAEEVIANADAETNDKDNTVKERHISLIPLAKKEEKPTPAYETEIQQLHQKVAMLQEKVELLEVANNASQSDKNFLQESLTKTQESVVQAQEREREALLLLGAKEKQLQQLQSIDYGNAVVKFEEETIEILASYGSDLEELTTTNLRLREGMQSYEQTMKMLINRLADLEKNQLIHQQELKASQQASASKTERTVYNNEHDEDLDDEDEYERNYMQEDSFTKRLKLFIKRILDV